MSNVNKCFHRALMAKVSICDHVYGSVGLVHEESSRVGTVEGKRAGTFEVGAAGANVHPLLTLATAHQESGHRLSG